MCFKGDFPENSLKNHLLIVHAFLGHSSSTEAINTYRTEVINRTIQRRRGVRDLSVRLRRQFSHPERVLNVMEDSMLSGVYRRQKRDRRLLKWSFKAKVKRSLKRYISELGPR